ncbi:hypothetical protein [Streptomyces silvisoli]|uniref:FtsK domain-containing protein n=1 Tax=Streptomyces silvisoli TaxID=3034235 RepID=A0ABT5ZEV3_9ACTN|nr:hypothetical protein [Streptomyces silvisoli]MDF3288357.1 hypothetical protein [Streptomyces silvisoli]
MTPKTTADRERRAVKSLDLKSTRRTPGDDSLLPPVDWAKGHGPVTGALSATTGAAAVALLGTATGMPDGWPLVIGAAGALGHGIGHSVHRKLTLRSAVARAASWLVAGGWTTWAMAHGPLSWAAAGSLAAVGLGTWAAASHTTAWEEVTEEERFSAEAKAAAADLDARRRIVAREWQERIKRVCAVDVTVVAVEFWPTGAGFSLEAELPAGGITWDRINARSRGLATDARLPLGCTVRVEEGAAQGLVVLDIMTKNVLKEEKLYPEDYSPLSILTGIPWCMRPNSEEIRVFLREACALLLGPPGSGKSTFLDVILAGFARCTDVVTWVIDLKMGAIGLSWVIPWLEAQGLIPPHGEKAPDGTRPGVDWLASTPKEAVRLLKAALRIGDARQLRYQALMMQKNTTLLPVSPSLPQIMIVVDEGAEVLAHLNSRRDPEKRELAQLIKRGMRTLRAMGIRFVLTAVDGNVSAIGDTEVKRFSPVAVALTSGEQAGHNVAKLFPNARIDSSQLNEKGSGVIGDAGSTGFAPTEFKGWKSQPSLARAVTLATNDRRPELDQVSAEAAGDDYARRWSQERAGWLWATATNSTSTSDATTASATTVVLDKPESPTPGDGDSRKTLGLSYQRRDDHDPDALAARLMADIDRTYGTTDEPPRDSGTPQDGGSGAPRRRPTLGLSYERNTPSPPNTSGGDQREPIGEGPDWLAQAIDAIESAGAMGMKPSAVADHVGRSRLAVRNALKAAAERGELVYRDNGPHSVYVHPDHA